MRKGTPKNRIDGLVQDCSISSALAIEILQFCTKPSVFSPQKVKKRGSNGGTYVSPKLEGVPSPGSHRPKTPLDPYRENAVSMLVMWKQFSVQDRQEWHLIHNKDIRWIECVYVTCMGSVKCRYVPESDRYWPDAARDWPWSTILLPTEVRLILEILQ